MQKLDSWTASMDDDLMHIPETPKSHYEKEA